ncbi:hypothetical protein AMTRI_Chr09g13940 [Amborella trichopoda]
MTLTFLVLVASAVEGRSLRNYGFDLPPPRSFCSGGLSEYCIAKMGASDIVLKETIEELCAVGLKCDLVKAEGPCDYSRTSTSLHSSEHFITYASHNYKHNGLGAVATLAFLLRFLDSEH